MSGSAQAPNPMSGSERGPDPVSAGDAAVLLLRLAGPLQSWGSDSQFNRRETRHQPTKSGVLGLLAAAQGRQRGDDIADLLRLRLGVRVDQPGTLLRDYHTASDYRGRPLPSAAVTATGIQRPTAPPKYTHVTQRFYVQDAVFVAGVGGPRETVVALADAVESPAYPLALGRRSCVPAARVVAGVRDGDVRSALAALPWQVSPYARDEYVRRYGCRPSAVRLPATLDDPRGAETLQDVPVTFHPWHRKFTRRPVSHYWLTVSTGIDDADGSIDSHDPFALLEW